MSTAAFSPRQASLFTGTAVLKLDGQDILPAWPLSEMLPNGNLPASYCLAGLTPLWVDSGCLNNVSIAGCLWLSLWVDRVGALGRITRRENNGTADVLYNFFISG